MAVFPIISLLSFYGLHLPYLSLSAFPYVTSVLLWTFSLYCLLDQCWSLHGTVQFFKHNYLVHMYLMYPLLAQVYFFVNVLLATNFLWVLLSLRTHIASLANLFASSHIAILSLFLLEFAYICCKSFFAFLCEIIFSEVRKDNWKSCIFDYENANKLKCLSS